MRIQSRFMRVLLAAGFFIAAVVSVPAYTFAQCESDSSGCSCTLCCPDGSCFTDGCNNGEGCYSNCSCYSNDDTSIGTTRYDNCENKFVVTDDQCGPPLIQ